MKNFKTTIGFLAIVVITLTSCMEDKKANNSTAEDIEMKSEMENNTKTSNKENSSTEMLLATNDNNKMTTKEGNVIERTPESKVKAMQISGWKSFNALSVEMKKLEGADYNTLTAAVPTLNSTISTLKSTRPEWMMTEEITEDIEDVEKEYREYIEEKNGKEKRNIRNLEELNEAYADLVEEINETFDQYVSINRKANEEFREEMDDDGDIDDAREEYNEEIKKLNKVADDK